MRGNWSRLAGLSWPLCNSPASTSLVLHFLSACKPFFPPIPYTKQSCLALTGPSRPSTSRGGSHTQLWRSKKENKVEKREEERGSGGWGDWSVSNLNKPVGRLKLAASFPFAHMKKRKKGEIKRWQKESRNREVEIEMSPCGFSYSHGRVRGQRMENGGI